MIDPEDARWPSYDEVVGILYELATGLFGSAENPYPAFDVMDRGLIESAVALPHQSYYESFSGRLAAMVRSLAANHGLRDGNKRLALTVLHSTLIVNHCIYLWNDDAAEVLVTRCAQGDTDFRWLAEFIDLWTAPVPDDAEVGYPQFTDPDALRDLIEGLRAALDTKIIEGSAIERTFNSYIRLHAEGNLPPFELAILREIRTGFPDELEVAP